MLTISTETQCPTTGGGPKHEREAPIELRGEDQPGEHDLRGCPARLAGGRPGRGFRARLAVGPSRSIARRGHGICARGLDTPRRPWRPDRATPPRRDRDEQ